MPNATADDVRVGATVAAMLAIAVLAGCDDEDSTVTVTQTVAPEPATATTDGATAPSEPVASSEADIDGTPIRLDVTELTRHGGTVLLRFTLTNVGARANHLLSLRPEFESVGEGVLGGNGAIDGITLIDPVQGQQYPVARDPDKGCLCSRIATFTALRPDEPSQYFATFRDVPLSVGEADVSTPGRFGSLPGIPIG